MYHQFNIHKSTSYQHSVCLCFVWISEQTTFISQYSINLLVFITETECLLPGTDWMFKYNSGTFLFPSLCLPHFRSLYLVSSVLFSGTSGLGLEIFRTVDIPNSVRNISLFKRLNPNKGMILKKIRPMCTIESVFFKGFFFFFFLWGRRNPA
jgi:hypothetical protein